MANTFPAAAPQPDQGDLLAGQGLDSAPVKLLPLASNFAQAHNGTGTPRIIQYFPRRGPTSPATATGVFVGTVAADSQHCSWYIPDTRGATVAQCYAWGYSAAPGGKIAFKSVVGADTTGMNNLPDPTGLWGPFPLTIDTSGGYDEIQLWSNATDGDVTIDCVMVVVEPLTSPLAAGADSLGCISFDADEHDDNEPLASDTGHQIVTNITAIRTIPHVYWNWSAIDDVADATKLKMDHKPHVIPVLVWEDTDKYSWALTIWVRTKSNSGTVDETTVINVGLGARPETYFKRVTITTPAAQVGEAWHSATIQLPRGKKYLRNCPYETVTLVVNPRMDDPIGLISDSDYVRKYQGNTNQLSTAQLRSISVWGV